jgi:ribosomal protein S18 acetylase RimI-like enzyme
MSTSVRRGESTDDAAVVALATEVLGDARQVHSRRQFHVLDGDVLVAVDDDEVVGFVSCALEQPEAELLAIATRHPRSGVGRSLVDAIERLARSAGCASLAIVTTDANVGAQAFYEALGYTLTSRRVGAVDECRAKYKPTIPPDMHDELVYAKAL